MPDCVRVNRVRTRGFAQVFSIRAAILLPLQKRTRCEESTFQPQDAKRGDGLGSIEFAQIEFAQIFLVRAAALLLFQETTLLG